MTSNQISYAKAKIDEAHYLRSDAENQRHNIAVEQLTHESNEEARRANLARETELHRANVASESNYYANLLENARHNRATESLNAQSLALQADRYQYQNKLDESSAALNYYRAENVSEDTNLKGEQVTGQQLSNKQQTLNYTLNSIYGEAERVFDTIKGLKVFGVPVGDTVVAGVKLATGGYFNKGSSKSTRQPKKEYFSLNTK